MHLPETERVVFKTMKNDLVVTKKDDLLEMEFPAYQLKKIEVTRQMAEALGAEPKEAYLGRDLLCVFDDETVAYQTSQRGGTLYCRMEGKKVFMAGKAVLFSAGELML